MDTSYLKTNMVEDRVEVIKALLSDCLIKDQIAIRKRLNKLDRIKTNDQRTRQLDSLLSRAERSADLVVKKSASRPVISFPEELPVSQKKDEIAKAIAENQVVVVAGETGSGKTTQIPKICMQLGRGVKGTIGHTQPRRLAARTVAMRIAEEVNSEIGETVGYQVRFSDHVSDNTLVKLMTDGILLAEIQRDRFLNAYDTIIIDEAHERSLNIDFLLGYLKTLLPRRKDLKVIITSATIDVDRFSKHFDDAPVIEVSGRTFPVEQRYRPLYESEDSEDDFSLNDAVEQAVSEIIEEEKRNKTPMGDILVFLPGEREIRDLAKHLRHCEFRDTEVSPLYARLSVAEQQKIFKPHRGRRIVLSTNVAETSITVPGIRYVIDPGTARISRYSYRSKIQRLPVEAVSQASANQRKGRCGRVAAGVCYRLYSEDDFNSRAEFTDPEILRTNLGSVILKMVDLGLGDIEAFPFVDRPDSRLVNDGFKLLFELGAVDQKRNLTPQGRALAKIPVDPRIGRMLIEANQQCSLTETLIITSALSIQDPRERPAEKRQAADQAHAVYKDVDSDFIGFVNLWTHYEEQRQALSSNQLKKYCQKHFLNFMRMREWREVHRQLHLICKELNFTENSEAASYDSIHKALLSGLMNNIGEKYEKREYKGARNRRFHIFPGSACYKKPPKWVVASELVETTQVFARINARIEPLWVESLAPHVYKKSYFEPHWEQKRAQVIAYERISLYGLDIVPKRKVNYGAIDPTLCRDFFIRHALVQGEFHSKATFLKHNLALIEQVDELEIRIRKKDILVDDDVLYDFYDQNIPQNIVSGRHFETWWKRLDGASLDALRLTKSFLMKRNAAEVNDTTYPDNFAINELKFKLDYQFSPGKEGDGVSIVVPAGAVRQLPIKRLDWVVPGLLREKCVQLVKSLPRSIRKHFVPVPDMVDRALKNIQPTDESLVRVLGRELTRITGHKIPEDSWNDQAIDDHLKFNIQVVGKSGDIERESRDLLGLMEEYKDVEYDLPKQSGKQETRYQQEYKDWTFGDLLLEQEVEQGGIKISLIPIIEDHKHFVKLAFSNDKLAASESNIRGVARLTLIAMPDLVKTIVDNLKEYKKTCLLFAPYIKAADLTDDLLLACVKQLLEKRALPRNKQAFNDWVIQCRSSLYECAGELSLLLRKIAEQHHELQKRLKGKINLALATSMNDLKFQLGQLIYQGFLTDTPSEWIVHFPRYLAAASDRFDKMPRELGNERTFLSAIDGCWDQYSEQKKQCRQQGVINLELEKYRWMLEELRVSWFSQKLGTAMTISEKRLSKQWSLISH